MTASPFTVRGYMLDVSRDRVPTRETLEVLVQLLGACGYNQLELYTEHTFAHAGHEAVWRDASPITADDMAWLDGLCASRGIALVANRNSLGHMERWLEHPDYLHRAENPEGFEMWGRHLAASTLAVTDDNLAFVRSLLDELVATTSTRRVNIGMDEPWEFGRGATRERVEREGQGKVYTDWVLDVAQPWLDKGYRVEMWGDILGHYPEQATRLPDGLDLVIWGYDSPEYHVRDAQWAGREVPGAPGFAGQLAPFAARGEQLWVAPGTGTWNSVIGRLDCALPNIVDAVEQGSRVGAGGYLMTTWGDSGHWEGYIHCLVPIIAGGILAADPDRTEELLDRAGLTRAVGSVLFGDEGHPGAELLVRLGYVVDLLDAPVLNQTLLFRALFGPSEMPPPVDGGLDAAAAELADLRTLAATLPPAGWVDEVVTAIDLAEVALTRLRGEPADIDADLVARVRRNWLATSRPGGLEDSLRRLPGLEPGTATASAEHPYWAGILGR